MITNIEPRINLEQYGDIPYHLFYEENQTLNFGIVPLRIYLRNE